MKATHAALLLVGAMAAAMASPVHATSYVPVPDEALVDQAAAVAVVRVTAAEPSSHAGRPATEYTAEVERALKGQPGGTITLRVPGGVAAGGKALKIWGAPRFAAGERALLFLRPNADGTYSVLHLMLGAFHAVPAAGRRLAVRDLSEARQVYGGPERLRDFGRFSRWIAARARGEKRQADYFVDDAAGKSGQATAPFTILRDADSKPVRWFEFDGGGHVSWHAHETGQSGLTGGGYTEILAALQAWTTDPGSAIDYRYAGTTDSTDGLLSPDGLNTILFNDPNDELSFFSCISGGILAYGGPWYGQSTAPYQGTTFYITLEADVVINDGLECFLTGKGAEELFAHELGHTLGLGHSAVSEALMRSFIHNDNRGASLRADDRAGAAYLYSATPPPATSLYTVTPCRLVDTRMGMGGGALQNQQTAFYAAAGHCGIPSTARALVANVTVIGPSGGGHVTAYPAGLPTDPVPLSSTVSFGAGQTRANNTLLGLSDTPDRFFAVHPVIAGSNGQTHLIVDVNGYFQ